MGDILVEAVTGEGDGTEVKYADIVEATLPDVGEQRLLTRRVNTLHNARHPRCRPSARQHRVLSQRSLQPSLALPSSRRHVRRAFSTLALRCTAVSYHHKETCRPPACPPNTVTDLLPVREVVETLDPLLVPFISPFVGESSSSLRLRCRHRSAALAVLLPPPPPPWRRLWAAALKYPSVHPPPPLTPLLPSPPSPEGLQVPINAKAQEVRTTVVQSFAATAAASLATGLLVGYLLGRASGGGGRGGGDDGSGGGGGRR